MGSGQFTVDLVQFTVNSSPSVLEYEVMINLTSLEVRGGFARLKSWSASYSISIYILVVTLNTRGFCRGVIVANFQIFVLI